MLFIQSWNAMPRMPMPIHTPPYTYADVYDNLEFTMLSPALAFIWMTFGVSSVLVTKPMDTMIRKLPPKAVQNMRITLG